MGEPIARDATPRGVPSRSRSPSVTAWSSPSEQGPSCSGASRTASPRELSDCLAGWLVRAASNAGPLDSALNTYVIRDVGHAEILKRGIFFFPQQRSFFPAGLS